jgi:hypothetical protein
MGGREEEEREDRLGDQGNQSTPNDTKPTACGHGKYLIVVALEAEELLEVRFAKHLPMGRRIGARGKRAVALGAAEAVLVEHHGVRRDLPHPAHKNVHPRRLHQEPIHPSRRLTFSMK